MLPTEARMAAYDGLIGTARGFLAELDANMSRDWFEAEKPRYETGLKRPALALLDDLAPRLAALTGETVTTKLFRPHRDVRFSKDKTPYTTHLHMMWALESEARQSPVFFFGIGLDYVTAGAGMMGFDKPVLEDWRKVVDLDTGRIQAVLAAAEADGFRRREPDLKRVPAPYPADHPAGDLLRLKGLTLSHELGVAAVLPEDLMAAFEALWPVNALLLEVARG